MDSPPATRSGLIRFTPFTRAVVLLSLAAVAISLFSLWWVHPALSWNRDEPVYLWHAQLLRSGMLTAPGGEPLAAFRPWLSGITHGSYFSQYTLGWPVVILVSTLLFGSATGAVVVGTVLAVVGAVAVTREVVRRNDVAVAVGALVLASPVIVIQAGVYLGYLFTMGLGNLALAIGWSGFRLDRRWRLTVAGALLGCILLTRPFDAVLWGAILGFGAIVRHRGAAVRSCWPIVVTGVPFVVVTLAYNRHITGAITTFPIVATDPLDTFGLGTRRLMPGFGPVSYGVGSASTSTLKNMAFTALFLAGNVVTAVFAAWGIWRRRHLPDTWLLVGMGAVFPIGYFFFWGTYLSSLTARLVGSIYFVPAVVPLCALGVLGVLELDRRRAATWLAVAGLVVTIPVMANRIGVNHRISRSQQAWAQSVAALDERSLVIVAESGPYLLFKNPVSRNAPSLDGMILYATDLGAENFETIRAHPDRTPYLQVASAAAEELIPKEDPITPTVDLLPVDLATGSIIRLEPSYTPAAGAPVIVPFFDVAGRISQGSPDDVHLADDGTASGVFEFGPRRVGPGVMALPEGDSVLRIGFGAGVSRADAERSPRVRWEIPVEVRNGHVTAMLPAQETVLFAVGPDRKWYPRPGYPGTDLRVSVTP